MRLRFIGLAVCLLWAAPLAAQSSALVWPSDCGGAVRLRNDTGLPLGSLWLAIQADDLNNAPEIGRILLTDKSGTRVWDVDDNEDGDNDDAGEGDAIDATPRGNVEGWHRVQARTAADTLAPGQGYRLTLCDEQGNSLQFRALQTFSVLPGPTGSGDGGIGVAAGKLEIGVGGDQVEVRLPQLELPPLTTFVFTYVLENGYTFPLDKLTVFARQTDVSVLDITSSVGGTYDLPLRTYTFSSPLPPNGTAQMVFTLSNLSDQPAALSTGVTQVVFERFVIVAVVPSLGAWAVAALAVLLGGTGVFVLRRRA